MLNLSIWRSDPIKHFSIPSNPQTPQNNAKQNPQVADRQKMQPNLNIIRMKIQMSGESETHT